MSEGSYLQEKLRLSDFENCLGHILAKQRDIMQRFHILIESGQTKQALTMDILVLVTMKNAVKCDT